MSEVALSLSPCPGQLRAQPSPAPSERSRCRSAGGAHRAVPGGISACTAAGRGKVSDTSRDLSTRSYFASGNNICLFTVPGSGNGTRTRSYSRRALPRSAVLLSQFPTLGYLANAGTGQLLPPG